MHKELHAFTNKSLPETVPNSSSTYANKLKEMTTIIFKPKNIMQSTAKTKSDPINSDLEITDVRMIRNGGLVVKTSNADDLKK